MPSHVVACRFAARVALALMIAWTSLGRAVAAQAAPPSGPPGAERYRLTMPTLRKVMPALNDPGRAQCEQREEKQNPFAMTLAELTTSLERCAPIRNAVAKTGVSTRAAATILAAVLYASRRMAEEESAVAMGKQAATLPPGPLKDNVALLRQNQAELGRLTGIQARGSGS